RCVGAGTRASRRLRYTTRFRCRGGVEEEAVGAAEEGEGAAQGCAVGGSAFDPGAPAAGVEGSGGFAQVGVEPAHAQGRGAAEVRSEEHTAELQSREKLVCRRLL